MHDVKVYNSESNFMLNQSAGHHNANTWSTYRKSEVLSEVQQSNAVNEMESEE